MKTQPPSPEALETWLALTRAEELDCDRFNELLAPWLDGTLHDPKLLTLLEHHRTLCAECAEELALLKTALGSDDDAGEDQG